MDNAELRKIIDQYVDDRYYDKDKLLQYLLMHQMVGTEIFDYVDNKSLPGGKQAHSRYLDSDSGYYPLHKESFIDRMPFYFYMPDIDDYHDGGCLDWLFGELRVQEQQLGVYKSLDLLEAFYQDLRYLFYEKKISLKDIFNYTLHQAGHIESGLFTMWVDYLHIRDDYKLESDIMPDRLITEFNRALIAAGKEPEIYNILYDIRDGMFVRNDMRLEFPGIFPCDEDGNPIMEWISLRIKNAKNIFCTCEKSKKGILYVQITPETVIDAFDVQCELENDDDCWVRAYTGPMATEFDYEALKNYRNVLGLKQQEVADAIGANVRTYQKWESGETTPDGTNLLRLMNWLNIPNVHEVTKWK